MPPTREGPTPRWWLLAVAWAGWGMLSGALALALLVALVVLAAQGDAAGALIAGWVYAYFGIVIAVPIGVLYLPVLLAWARWGDGFGRVERARGALAGALAAPPALWVAWWYAARGTFHTSIADSALIGATVFAGTWLGLLLPRLLLSALRPGAFAVRVAMLLVVVAAGGCARPTARHASAAARADSVAVVRAAWESLVGEPSPLQPDRVVRFWAPLAPDTTGAVPLSRAARRALVRGGVPAIDRPAVGDDTVVVRLTRWQVDTGGVALVVWSEWTTVLGRGARRCRTGSGNRAELHVARRAGGWVATNAGPVLHGDRVCVPLP